MNKFLIGCDPELFLVDAAGAFKSSIGLIGGSKDFPRPLHELGDGYAVQEDNVAVEFNTPPAESAEQFNTFVSRTIEYLQEYVNNMAGLTFSKESAAIFPNSELENPMALNFGCDPDYNAWTMKRNPRPKAINAALRSCGGHVHVGYKFVDVKQASTLIKLMDKYLGIPSVLMDTGELRKELYGKHGACRFKPYGVEYRVLSNFWIFDEKLRTWVYNNTSMALDALLNGEDPTDEHQVISHIIDSNDKHMAKQYVEERGIVVV